MWIDDGGGMGRQSVSDGVLQSSGMASASEAHQRALAYIDSVGFETEQVNGQYIVKRRTAARAGAAPSRSPEVFITHIPHDCYEDVLFPIFYGIGNLQEFRLMVEFSGSARGIGYALYQNESDVERCICQLHKIPLGNHTIYVVRSTNICWLKIYDIPTNPKHATDFIHECTQNITQVYIKKKLTSLTVAVEYETHKAAALARRSLKSLLGRHWNYTVKVEWGKQPLATEIIDYQIQMIVGNDGSVITQYLNSNQCNNSTPSIVTNAGSQNFTQNWQSYEPNSHTKYNFNTNIRKPQPEVCFSKPNLTSYTSNATLATTPQHNWDLSFNNWNNQVYQNKLGRNYSMALYENTHHDIPSSNSSTSPYTLWNDFNLNGSEIKCSGENNTQLNVIDKYEKPNNTYDNGNQSLNDSLYDMLSRFNNFKI